MSLRVMIVTPWGERLGGAEEMLWLALSHIDRERIDPFVVFLGPGPFEREVAGLGIPTAVIPVGRLRRPVATIGAIWKLGRLLRSRRPDLLLNWSAKSQIYGSLAAAAAGLRGRSVWWQHQIPDGHWVDRLATRLPAKEIGCSSRAGLEAQQTLSPQRPTFVVNPGIVVAEDRGAAGSSMRSRLGIPDGRLVVGIVGRLQPWKGQDRFLAALADLRERGHDIHGLVVGGDAFDLSPEYANSLRDLVGRLGLADSVTMTGQVPDSGPYLKLMDVAVNASEQEPFGIVLLEAMAAGTPVVAVGCGGPVDIVESGRTGMLAKSGNPRELADAIDLLLADPDRRAEMAVEGRRRCLDRFTAQGMGDRLTAELSRIADD